jgi:hypothetical protein
MRQYKIQAGLIREGSINPRVFAGPANVDRILYHRLRRDNMRVTASVLGHKKPVYSTHFAALEDAYVVWLRGEKKSRKDLQRFGLKDQFLDVGMLTAYPEAFARVVDGG